MGGLRKPTANAAIGLALWLLLVVGFVLWSRPRFWVEPHDEFRRAEALWSEGRTAMALAAVARASAEAPDNVGYRVFKGYRELDLDHAAQAERTFREALRRQPSDIEGQLGLAAALTRQQQREAALAVLQSQSAEALSDGQIRRRSQLYARLQAPVLALDDLTQLLHGDPDNPELLHEAALLAHAQMDWNEVAALTLRLGSATDDPQVKAWAADTRGEALQALGRLDEALEAFQETNDPDRLESRAALATQLRQYARAADLYMQLVQRHPEERRFRRSLAFAQQAAGQTSEAERTLRRLVTDGEANSDTRTTLAWLLNTQRRHAEAWQVLEPLPRPAEDTALLDLQARTALWAGRNEEAAQLLHALVDRRPQSAELWKRLAESWEALGEPAQAADALRAYLRVQSQDWRAREQLADILARQGSLGAAIAEYRKLVAVEPTNPRLRQSLGLVEESAGQLDAALGSYLRAINDTGRADPALQLRVARLYRWTSEPRQAVEWYEKYLAAESDPVLRRRAETELAVALLDAGDPSGSLSRLQSAAPIVSLDADELLTGARAATATGAHPDAIRFLELLSARRSLMRDEQLWLAGAYRADGRTHRALAAYEQVAAADRIPDKGVLEAVGDLRFDHGDYAGALRAFGTLTAEDQVSLKVARTAAAAGQLALATEHYERHTRLHPDDTAAHLETARYYASAGRPEMAIARYRQVVAARGPADLRLELARIHLAAGQFDDAEQWARQAIAAGEDGNQSRLALAQSLHLQGAGRDADAVLKDLMSRRGAAGEALAWRSYVAAARDRQLGAYRFAERAIVAGAGDRNRLRMGMAVAAQRRGDFTRARAAIADAAAAGASAPEVAAARAQLRLATRPTLLVPSWLHVDTNDLHLTSRGAGFAVRIPALRGTLSLDVSHGTVAQHALTSDRISIALGLGQLFPTPALELQFGAGLDRYSRAADLVAWQATGTYHLTGGSMLGGSAGRESLLPTGHTPELRQFNPVRDITSLGPGFWIQGARVFFDGITDGNYRTRAEAALESLQDGNRRLSSYVHLQLPLRNSVSHWATIRPNLFVESFRDTRAPYFSPRMHWTLGTMWHSIRRYQRAQVELEVNPQWLHTDGNNGFGLHGLFHVEVKLGRVTVMGGTFVFYDSLERYVQGRFNGRVIIPLGR